MKNKVYELAMVLIILGCWIPINVYAEKSSTHQAEHPDPQQIFALEDFKPVTSGDVKKKKRVSNADKARENNTQAPEYFNAISVFDYMSGKLYPVYTSPIHLTDISLQPGESLTSQPAAGDTARWMIASAESGGEGGVTQHILIKPTQPGLQTNLIVFTDRHTYHMQLRSYNESYMASVKWRYPSEDFKKIQRQISLKDRAEQQEVAPVNLENVDFGYVIKSKKKVRWAPTAVFNDGEKTYIKFPPSVKQGDLPPLFLLGEKKKRVKLINYRYRNGYYIVDRLFDAAVLRVGAKSEREVYIYSEAYHNKKMSLSSSNERER